ncbi:hypothetical protein [Sphingomonas sp. 3-13AW]|uniref:hypothetical protein n=1 Tax=Sphingomonas sp. 3-13AW TaxID=3050450 RepID=UPI003BB69726
MGYLSTTQTLALVLLKSAPERAYSLSSSNGWIAAKLAERRSLGNMDAAQRRDVDRLARQALANEPLAVPALTALALNTLRSGDVDRARRLFVHSDAISRRDLSTRLWLIEDAVGRNDIPRTLRNYDIALRTSRNAPAILFPVLSAAISDPAISERLADTLAGRPPWAELFVNYLAGSGVSPIARATLFRRLSLRGVAPSQAAQAAIVNALIDAGAPQDGWTYYQTLRGNIDRRRSRDPDFKALLEAPSVLDWMPVMNDAGVMASIQRTSNGGIFEFEVPSTIGGTVLQQVQILPPGRYRMEGTSVVIAQTPNSRPYWQLSCMTGRELGRVEIPNSSERAGGFSGEFQVSGAACPTQMLRLIVRPSSDIGGVTGQIKRAAIVPIAED